MSERRRVERHACRIPAASAECGTVIEDMSAHGARVRSAVAARKGDALPLYLCEQNGRQWKLRGVVRRVRRTVRGYEIGCSFDGDPASSVAAWRLAQAAARGAADTFVPIAPRARASRGSFADHFGLRTLLLLSGGVVALGLASIIAYAYFALV